MSAQSPINSKPKSALKTVRRWTFLLVSGSFTSVIFFLTIVVLINLRDEPLKLATQAMMREPGYLVPDERNGFFVLRAIDAEASVDAFAAGRDVVRAGEARYRADAAHFDVGHTDSSYQQLPKSAWDSRRCGPAPANCVQADLRNRAQLEALVLANATLLQRYNTMQAMDGFEEHVIPTVNAQIPNFGLLVQASDMALFNAEIDIADGNLKQGIERLQANDRYLRFLLQKSSTIVSRMVDLAMMRKQARTVSELLESYPILGEQYGDVLATLARPMTEQNFSSVFATGARNELSYLQHMKIGEAKDTLKGSMSERLSDNMSKLFYHRDATLNRIAELWRQRIEWENQAASRQHQLHGHVIEMPDQLAESSNFSFTSYLYNPIGTILANVALGSPDVYVSYRRKSVDVDGYLNLIGLQIDLRRKKIADAAIADFIANASENFRSPYDFAPMIWDAKDKQLQFIGREKARANLDGGKVFIVALQ